jgi:DNA polymerase III epsilon subunit-like protein
MTIHSGMVHLDGNILAAMDYETTGTVPGYHEVIQVGIVPLDADLRPSKVVRPFYHNIAPLYPERQEHGAGDVHKLDLNWLQENAPSHERVADLLVDWWEKLDLPVGRKVTPLAHNYEFEAGFSRGWLGHDLFNDLFYWGARDGMRLAMSMNDRAAFAGEPLPFNLVGLEALCKKFGVVNENPHDALADSYAEAEVYRSLLLFGMD